MRSSRLPVNSAVAAISSARARRMRVVGRYGGGHRERTGRLRLDGLVQCAMDEREPGAGSGDGTVQVVAGANTGGSRTGTATVAGRTFTVQQAAACTYDVQPTAIDRNWREWTIRIHVTAASGCAWTASTDAEWLTITSGASGSGDGGADLVMSENSGAERTDIVRVAGKAVVVVQRGR